MYFEKLLVANRGEISSRVFRACRNLGITSVAVYSDADEDSLYVRNADEAYRIGAAPASESYLDMDSIVAAIKKSGADAVHPGYGFLSESAEFARAVQQAGATWVGPSPEAMEKVGLKVRAKELAESAGVPVIPGYDGGDQSQEKLVREASKIGYPVLVKASAGGGGRGMREVYEARRLPEAIQSARREAEAAFSDGTVFIEKLIEKPRHIEVQIMADHHGNIVHLYERECSIQRRHQKVIEEAPSPVLSREKRDEICAAAVRLAGEVGYANAGTVEFLFAETGEFYFLEMNARLQVEHPVTEEVTGQDLVKMQIAVAAGENLLVQQKDIRLSGCAIEARIYAEDDSGLPTGGRLLAFDPPEGNGVRNEIGVATGDEISLNYDAMISKLIVHAPDRESAVTKLSRSLSEYQIIGVTTNIPLLRRIVKVSAFENGDTTTDFLRHEGLEGSTSTLMPEEFYALAAIVDTVSRKGKVDVFDSGAWRHLGMGRHVYRQGEEVRTVEVVRNGKFHVATLDGVSHAVEILTVSGEDVPTVYGVSGGKSVHGRVSPTGVEIRYGDEERVVLRRGVPDVGDHTGGAGSAGGLVAPMPGTVIQVLVEEGDEVSEGQVLVVLEAMKMEQPILAPGDGVVTSVPFGEGEMVAGGVVIVELEVIQAESGE